MRRSILLAVMLAGGLTLVAGAEAEARQGDRGGQAWMFPRSQAWVFPHRQQFAQPSSLRLYPLWQHGPRFAPGRRVGCFGYPACGPRFRPRPPVVRFVGPGPVVPLSQQPGFRVLNGRNILPTVGIPVRPLVVRPVRPVIVRPSYHFPTYVRVVPAPGFAPRPGLVVRDGTFGIPRRVGGLTIVVRDPAGIAPGQ